MTNHYYHFVRDLTFSEEIPLKWVRLKGERSLILEKHLLFESRLPTL